MTADTTDVFTAWESNVRSYCRSWPAVFERAKGALLFDEAGRRYLDFFAGAGALNYGHNDDTVKAALMDYLASDNIMHALDCYTVAKRDFLVALHNYILQPRGLDYKCQFPNPTGTNAVEAALKLARKVKGRTGIFAFMGGFHGMTLGSLAATGNKSSRQGGGVPLSNVTFMPYPYKFMESFDTIDYMDTVLTDANSGVETPAAVILETVQSEGGIVVAPIPWLQRLQALCAKHDMLLICDDIQVGCGRTGAFFSFERAGIVPDIVVISKSISGFGLPLSLVLFKPELDVWSPGEHNGTFRGNQLAFVAGTAALTKYWADDSMAATVAQREAYLRLFLEREILPLHTGIVLRGLGCIWGIDVEGVGDPTLSGRIARRCFELGLVVERCGRNDQVLKIMPPLTIEMDLLAEGCRIIRRAMGEILG
jgi:diaminobutyrate-2-oxoglutarate transaminase